MKLDILAFGAHPDDVELACSGTLAKHHKMGHKTGVDDLTDGELGTRGTPELRRTEAMKAAEIMGLATRHFFGFRDGFFLNDEQHRIKVIEILRHFQPDIVITNAPSDRHPDHGRGCNLVTDACFLSGLRRIGTTYENHEQQPWRPKLVLHYIQDRYFKPDIVVDISKFFDARMNAILAYKSQFHDPESAEPKTYISSPEFIDSLKSRPAEFGRLIGVDYAEGFLFSRITGINDLKTLI